MSTAKNATTDDATSGDKSGSRGRRQLDQLNSEPRMSLAAEFWWFLKYNKKWWLAPILLVLGALALLVVLGGTSAAPFIYTLGV